MQLGTPSPPKPKYQTTRRRAPYSSMRPKSSLFSSPSVYTLTLVSPFSCPGLLCLLIAREWRTGRKHHHHIITDEAHAPITSRGSQAACGRSWMPLWVHSSGSQTYPALRSRSRASRCSCGVLPSIRLKPTARGATWDHARSGGLHRLPHAGATATYQIGRAHV